MRQKIELDERDYQQIETLSGFGLSSEKIAAILDMCKATFDRRMAEDDRVKEALLKGRSKISAKVINTAYNMAVSGKHPTMTIFWLKCRERWKDSDLSIDKDAISINISKQCECKSN